ncbi:hypothetical protein [Lysinibacillus piscis]|uniref:Uncharacterized protein n=1 Tax=Lysinibacillus piscis TaxID=2518931 RepID=A0ABQ5NML8_9BACI|nr:hypothetical protein [Lysinibacillus sp. KH24]GLC89373.1 hypothetical protein LYSBPC_25000 [Lysinibacillus sp. KH24]
MLIITGEATVKFQAKLPVSEAEYEMLSESKAKQMIKDALFATGAKVLDIDIDVWDYEEVED